MISQLSTETHYISERCSGFPGVALGGYVAGLALHAVGGSAEIRLLRTPRTERTYHVEWKAPGQARVMDEEQTVAVAKRATIEIDVPRAVSWGEAVEATLGYPGRRSHLFPTCFCCGTNRSEGDGLRIFPGRIHGTHLVAAPWVPAADLAGDTGTVAPEYLGAAVDCPGLWALIEASPTDCPEQVVTANLRLSIRKPVEPGERYVVVAWPLPETGRRILAGAAILDEHGEPHVLAEQSCAVVECGMPLGLDAWRGKSV
jgi:hypothetical protein